MCFLIIDINPYKICKYVFAKFNDLLYTQIPSKESNIQNHFTYEYLIRYNTQGLIHE